MNSASIITSLAMGVCSVDDGPSMGQIISGSPTVKLTNSSAARNTDYVLSFCGHVGILVTGSSTVILNNLQRTRVGSVFSGTYTGNIIGGVDTVKIGG